MTRNVTAALLIFAMWAVEVALLVQTAYGSSWMVNVVLVATWAGLCVVPYAFSRRVE
jgi:uncharacterized membrane protein YpjA